MIAYFGEPDSILISGFMARNLARRGSKSSDKLKALISSKEPILKQ